MKSYIECGRIVAAHALAGEVKVQPWSDDPALFSSLSAVYLDQGVRTLYIDRCRLQKGMPLLKLRGVDSPEAAAALRGQTLYALRSDIPLAPGEHLIQDLIGLAVVDADSGAEYGRLCEVSQTGANDVYHIRFADGTVRLIPAIAQVVLAIDLGAEQMRIRPLPGLFDDEN